MGFAIGVLVGFALCALSVVIADKYGARCDRERAMKRLADEEGGGNWMFLPPIVVRESDLLRRKWKVN